ncbi:Pyruvate:ferredoxin oxidoreductase, beta subunit (EC [Olavius sp. associated proteobacterium Delta 1]|nr:Pyruvate:ferredoxin oxidoreductase, beta subunit (EC [Olavius sp. associated proteobacterium Delta 1]
MMNELYRPTEIMSPGQLTCPGCGLALGMRQVMRAMGKRCVVVVVPSCVAVTTGPYPNYTLGVPAFHSAFEIAAPTAAGIRNALVQQGKEDIPVLAFAGDGGTFDIGLQSLSGCADRNEDIIYVCMDNEAYMNTGVQVSSATPQFTWTGTSPSGNTRRKKKIMEIMAAHRMPYAATASPAFPEDLTRKIQKAKATRGTRFLHVLAPCNTGWKIKEDMAVKTAMLSVETNVFPLYEIEDGVNYTLNYESKGLPIENYLKVQGRYRHLKPEQIELMQAEVERNLDDLMARIARNPK